MRAQNILDTIGNTPHIRMNRLFGSAEVWIKSERTSSAVTALDAVPPKSKQTKLQ